MLPSKLEVNKRLLPIKGHYFFFNAGTAPLVPYLSTYARQLGFSSSTVGIIYTVLPISGLLAKPLFGIIADRFQIQKSILLIFQIITIISFSFIYFLPTKNAVATVGLGCRNDTTTIRSCYKTANLVDKCIISALRIEKDPASCQMNCHMSPKMWQHTCENWDMPYYCSNVIDRLQYTARLDAVTLKDQCAYIAASNVSLDGFTLTPSCRTGKEYVDLNEPCTLNCPDLKLNEVFNRHQTNMTCLEGNMNFRVCNETASFGLINNDNLNDECTVTCDLNKSSPRKLLEICDSWNASMTETCHSKTDMTGNFSFTDNFTFTGNVALSTIEKENECVFLQMTYFTLPDVTIYNPSCTPQEQYQTFWRFAHNPCEIMCNHSELNRLLSDASASQVEESSRYNQLFWLFFTLMIISWIGQAVVVTFADVICFNLLGQQRQAFGRQRLWGSIGWGVFSLMTGYLIDLFSDGEFKDYTVAFVLMFFFLAADVAVSCFLQIQSPKMSRNILIDVGALFSSKRIFVFLLWTIAVGICTGLVWQFLFWLIEDLSSGHCTRWGYVKTLQGLVSAIQTFCGEIPFLHKSGSILKKYGHTKVMNLVLYAFSLRFFLYSIVKNPWWILPIELLQGVTFGMFYPTLTSYADIVAAPGTETTVQGLVGAVFEGVGTSLGSFVGGHLYGRYGGVKTFRWFSFGALTTGALHTGAHYLMRKEPKEIKPPKGQKNRPESIISDSIVSDVKPSKSRLKNRASSVKSKKSRSESITSDSIVSNVEPSKSRFSNRSSAVKSYPAVQYTQQNDTVFIMEDEGKS